MPGVTIVFHWRPVCRHLVGRVILVLVVLVSAAGGAFAQTPPPHLDILSARIREVPPIDPTDILGRTVVIELTLAGSPTCTGSSPFTVYGVLIDSDLDPNTGITNPAFDPLGVDARLTAKCDQATSAFISEAGPVIVSPPGPGGESLLTITTTVAAMPAIEFEWIAIAVETADLTRLPEAPDPALWAIHERRVW